MPGQVRIGAIGGAVTNEGKDAERRIVERLDVRLAAIERRIGERRQAQQPSSKASPSSATVAGMPKSTGLSDASTTPSRKRSSSRT